MITLLCSAQPEYKISRLDFNSEHVSEGLNTLAISNCYQIGISTFGLTTMLIKLVR